MKKRFNIKEWQEKNLPKKEVNEAIDGRMVEIKLKNIKQDLDAVKDFYGDDDIEKAREYLEDVKENITYLLKRMK